MNSWPATWLSRSREPLIFFADQLRRAVCICGGFMARTARSELLARARGAIRVGPCGERARRVAARSVAWGNVRSRAADPPHPDAPFAAAAAADDGDSRGQSPRSGAVRRERGCALPAVRHAGFGAAISGARPAAARHHHGDRALAESLPGVRTARS